MIAPIPRYRAARRQSSTGGARHEGQKPAASRYRAATVRVWLPNEESTTYGVVPGEGAFLAVRALVEALRLQGVNAGGKPAFLSEERDDDTE